MLCAESPGTANCPGPSLEGRLRQWSHPPQMVGFCAWRWGLETGVGGGQKRWHPETFWSKSRRSINGNVKPNQKKQTPGRRRRRRKGTIADPSTRWHSVPSSSVFICDFVPSKNTVYSTFHILSDAPLLSLCPSFKVMGIELGSREAMAKGEGVACT